MSLKARTEQTSSGETFSVTPISIAEALRSTSKQFGEPGTYLVWSEGDAVHLSVGATLDVAVVEARKALADHFEASAGIGNVYLVLDAVDSAALEAMEAKSLYDLAYALNDLAEAARDAVGRSTFDLQFRVLDEAALSTAPRKSIDYAVMEHTKVAAVVPAESAPASQPCFPNPVRP